MPSDVIQRRLGFRPRLGPTLASAIMFVLLLALGFWQVARHFEKTAINDFRAARAAAPPVALPAALTDLDTYDFHRIQVTGMFAHERELYVYARSQRGNEGYDIVTPLLREGAPPVLINRGWVPTDRKPQSSRAEGQVAGPVTVTGYLRHDARQSWLMPDNDPVRNAWFWFDLPAMSRAARLDSAVTFYLEADLTPNPGGMPIGAQTQIELPDPHVEYSITWFALAIGLIVIWFVWHRQAAGVKH